MGYALITAACIALCTLAGAAAGFLFENIPPAAEELLTAAAAGIMLGAALLGLIVPSLELSGGRAMWLTPAGVLCGALFLSGLGALTPRLSRRMGAGADEALRHALLFAAAIAIHHFPEGAAAGVSFGTGDPGDAVAVAGGIAFQTIPEAMVIVPPLLKAGAGRRGAALAAFLSGAVEAAGVFFGYLAVSAVNGALPFMLAFAAGTMLLVIVGDMLPQSQRRPGCLSAHAVLAGFCLICFLVSH